MDFIANELINISNDVKKAQGKIDRDSEKYIDLETDLDYISDKLKILANVIKEGNEQ